MDSRKLYLEKCASVCHYLDDLLKSSYGPNALHCLLSTSTGRIIITSSGHFILGSLHLSHPIGRLLVKAALSHHNISGDNSKTFILMVSEALRFITTKKLSISADDSYQRISLIRAFATLKNDILPFKVIPHITDHFSRHSSKPISTIDEARRHCFGIICGTLQGKFNKETRSHLSKIAEKFIFSNCEKIEQIPSLLIEIVSSFEWLCVDCPGQSILNTSIIEGIVVQRDFVGATAPCEELRNVNFILIDYPVEDCCPSEIETVIKVRSPREASDSLKWKSTRLERIVHGLSVKNIKIMLCTEIVSELFSFLLAQKEISIIQCVPKEDIERISSIAHLPVAGDDNDLIEVDKLIGRARNVNAIVAGGKRYILLRGLCEGRMNASVISTILLTAPTPGICDQVAAALLCIFKSVLMAFDQHLPRYTYKTDELMAHSQLPSDVCVTCPAGGAFEMSLYMKLKCLLREEKKINIPLQNACESIGESLLAVPQRLLENSFCTPDRKNRARLLKFIATNTHSCEECGFDYVSGLDGKSGLDILRDGHIVEPLSSKVSLLYAVIEVLEQILKMDYIVPVFKIIEKNKDEDLSD